MTQEAASAETYEELKAELVTVRQALSFLIGELCRCPETKGAVAKAHFHLEELHAIQAKSIGDDEHRKALCVIQTRTVEKLFDMTPR